MNRSSVQFRPVARESRSLSLLIASEGSSEVEHEDDCESNRSHENKVPIAERDLPEIGVGSESWHKWTHDKFSPYISLPIAGMTAR